MASCLGAGGRLRKGKASIVGLLWYKGMQEIKFEDAKGIEKLIGTQKV